MENMESAEISISELLKDEESFSKLKQLLKEQLTEEEFESATGNRGTTFKENGEIIESVKTNLELANFFLLAISHFAVLGSDEYIARFPKNEISELTGIPESEINSTSPENLADRIREAGLEMIRFESEEAEFKMAHASGEEQIKALNTYGNLILMRIAEKVSTFSLDKIVILIKKLVSFDKEQSAKHSGESFNAVLKKDRIFEDIVFLLDLEKNL